MSDLIDRQAAIDAIRDAENHAFNSFYKGLIKAHKIIADLPSVNPQKPKWISVGERLPEEPGTYMTTIDYGKYGLEVGQKYYYGQGLGWSYDCVIAWMPLPAPYKAESEE